ncbi:MAG: hypothetical protein UR66_C0003G0014 [Candidatus Moranbacteria bacterium GW2011_GWE1_35_17]|nr:MAG: hypothetical protein UR65_C0078G0003 [Candidatus Moranbacteria bacterium GW2011_GWE2_35_164]KKP68749.1 MAG: hypothetical protein UR66_C0003G0014 [Candidatus Moranbacteria bacterium GW2011_GWE1_35_17]KKP82940.1 MAG: hypothetical protein UR82_C0027G0014 [Candidatus Moranbacteria bacterium GW2011_GWF1_35_5]
MKTKIKIFKYAELVLIFLSATFTWRMADSLFKAADGSNWSWVMIFITAFFIIWSLGAIVIRDTRLFLGATILALLAQLFFTRNIGSLLVVVVSFLLLYLARIFIRQEIKLRLKVDIWNYLRVGRRFLIFAIALMLAGQYYFSSSTQIASENLPKMKFNYSQGGFMTKVVSLADPNLIKENNEAVTVDEFILNKFEEELRVAGKLNSGIISNDMLYGQRDVLLKESRKDISKMVEREVAGDEKMVDIFLEVIGNKLDSLLNINAGYMDKNMPVAHLIFTVAIFLAIMGTGMILSLVFIFMVAVVFRTLILLGLLAIDEKAVNMEVIRIG